MAPNASTMSTVKYVQSADVAPLKLESEMREEAEFCRKFSYFHICRPVKTNPNVRYLYINESKYGMVWQNVLAFFVLHLYYFYGLYIVLQTLPYQTWVFGK